MLLDSRRPGVPRCQWASIHACQQQARALGCIGHERQGCSVIHLTSSPCATRHAPLPPRHRCNITPLRPWHCRQRPAHRGLTTASLPSLVSTAFCKQTLDTPQTPALACSLLSRSYSYSFPPDTQLPSSTPALPHHPSARPPQLHPRPTLTTSRHDEDYFQGAYQRLLQPDPELTSSRTSSRTSSSSRPSHRKRYPRPFPSLPHAAG